MQAREVSGRRKKPYFSLPDLTTTHHICDIVSDTISMEEDNSNGAAIGKLLSIDDIDSNDIGGDEVLVVINVTAGVLHLDSTNTATGTMIAFTDDGRSITIHGTCSAVNGAINGIVYDHKCTGMEKLF